MTFETCLIQVLSTISAILVVGFSIQCVMLGESSLKRQRLLRELSISEDKRVILELAECNLKSSVESLGKSYSTSCDEIYSLKLRLNLIRELADTTASVEDTLDTFMNEDEGE